MALKRNLISQSVERSAGPSRSSSVPVDSNLSNAKPMNPLVVTRLDGNRYLTATDFLHRLMTPLPLGKKGDRQTPSSKPMPSPQATDISTASPVRHRLDRSSQEELSDMALLQSLAQPSNMDSGSAKPSGGTKDELATMLSPVRSSSPAFSSMESNKSDGNSVQRTRFDFESFQESLHAWDTKMDTSTHPTTQKFVTPIVRKVGAKNEVEGLFKTLRKHHLFFHSDVPTQSELDAKARGRVKKLEKHVNSVFAPTCAVLEAEWTHFRIGKEEQKRFREAYFSVPTHANYSTVSREVLKYASKTERTSELLRLVNQRETFVKRLVAQAKNPVLIEVHNKSIQESIVIEIFSYVLLLRFITCQIIDMVYQSREEENRITPLLWEGRNYMIKMQDDLATLQDSCLSLLLPGFRFRGNPMLLPPQYFVTSSVINSAISSGGGKGSKQTLGTFLPTGGTGNSPNKNSGNSSKIERRLSTSQTSDRGPELSSHVPVEAQRIIVAKYGEEVQYEPIVTKRQQYFAKLEKEEFLATHKVDMDRSNVYQYPPEVYLPKPKPSWQITGERLMRSLDPNVDSQPYDDRKNPNRFHVGRQRAPPELIVPVENVLIDDRTKAYRPTAPVPRFHFPELHLREVLLFGENAAIKKATAQNKLRRGLVKIRIAYRGFIQRMLKYRRQQEDTKLRSASAILAASAHFKDWVAEFAPQWLPELAEMLAKRTEQDELAALYSSDDDDDDDNVDYE